MTNGLNITNVHCPDPCTLKNYGTCVCATGLGKIQPLDSKDTVTNYNHVQQTISKKMIAQVQAGAWKGANV